MTPLISRMYPFSQFRSAEDREFVSLVSVDTQKPADEALPLVSVIIPVFNAAPFLAESVSSVLGQDYPNLEVIAVDDGSTDASLEILQGFGRRVRVLRRSNGGPAAARNVALKAAEGSMIAFHDADDIWLPGKLRAQVDFLTRHPDIGLVFGQFAFWRPGPDGTFPDPNWFAEHPETWEIKDQLSGWIYTDELRDCQIAMITPLVRRSVITSVGIFDETLASGSDYDYWLRVTYTTRCHKLDQCLALYRLHGNSVTTRVRATNFAYQIVKRALVRRGLVGPDGRRIPMQVLDRRLSAIALDFAELHLVRGSIRIGLHNIGLYFRHAGFAPRSVLNCSMRSVRALAKRARDRFWNRRPS